VKAEPVEALWGLNFKRGYHMPLIFFVRVLSYWRAVNLEMVDASLRLLDRFEHGGGMEFLATGDLAGPAGRGQNDRVRPILRDGLLASSSPGQQVNV